jgi:hypothetical protein
VFGKPKFMVNARKSAPVSPTVVAIILIIQKYSVTSGTLFNSLFMTLSDGLVAKEQLNFNN